MPWAILTRRRCRRALGGGAVGTGEATMHTTIPTLVGFTKSPWSKGRLIGQKRPLKPKEVSSIRVRLQLEGRKRDLALFNLAIDSKLRGCDQRREAVDEGPISGDRVRPDLQRGCAAALIMSAPFSAIMMTDALVLPETIVGMIDASTTRSPSSPRTRNSSSTTPIGSLPILHVPMT